MREILQLINEFQTKDPLKEKLNLNLFQKIKELFGKSSKAVKSIDEDKAFSDPKTQVLFEKILNSLVTLSECLSSSSVLKTQQVNAKYENQNTYTNSINKHFSLLIVLSLFCEPLSSFSHSLETSAQNRFQDSVLQNNVTSVALNTKVMNSQLTTSQYIEIDIIQRKLSLKDANHQIIKSYPVGVGNSKEFMTPIGVFAVKNKDAKPGWVHPYKPNVKIPPGPNSPLGSRWISFYNKGSLVYGIHGTNEPESVGKFSSHGCIRMLIKDSEDLFKRVQIGTPVRTIYNRFEIFALDTGDIALKVYDDPYQLEPLDLQRIENKVKEKFQNAHINEKAINYLIENNGKNFAETQNHSEQTTIIGYLNSFLQSNNSD